MIDCGRNNLVQVLKLRPQEVLWIIPPTPQNADLKFHLRMSICLPGDKKILGELSVS